MHISVLLQKTIEELSIKPGDIFVDATLGLGGHSAQVCEMFGRDVRIIGIDEDTLALRKADTRLKDLRCAYEIRKGNFRNLDKILDDIKISKVDKILFDLGINSEQFEESGRGFSFQRNEPLAMTICADISKASLTAEEIVNRWEPGNIATILKAYGEEQFAEKITAAIVQARKSAPIKTTFDLVEIIQSATPRFYHFRKIHPATKTFQALRITVNDEIASLQEGIRKGLDRLAPRGRMAVISFHSIEDRIVKNFFKLAAKDGKGNAITKKPIIPSREEIVSNPRSRSAKLRIFEKK